MKNKFLSRIGQWHTPPYLRKCLTSLKALALLLVMVASVNVWGATSEVVYTETFEDDAFKTSTTYNNKDEKMHGPTGKQWGVICGTPISSGHTGSKSFAMRYYASVKVTPYLTQYFNVQDVDSLKFWAKTESTNNKLTIEYSTNNGTSWNKLASDVAITTSFAEYKYEFETQLASVRIRFSMGTTTEKKSMIIDDIAFVKKSGDDPDPTEPSLSVSPKTIDFGTVYQKADVDAQQVTVTFSNLTADDVEANTDDLTVFDIDKYGPFTSGDKITITPNTYDRGNYEETLILFSETDGLEERVTITMNVVEAPAPTGTFVKYTGDELKEGDYVICVGTDAMKNSVTSSRLDYASVTVSSDKITNPEASVIWHIAPVSEGVWSIFNVVYDSDKGGYAAGTGTKNQAGILAATTDVSTEAKAQWTCAKVTNGYNFENVANKAKEVNSKLQKNGTYGFACYADFSDITLYKTYVEPAKSVVTFASCENGSVGATVNSSAISSGAIVDEDAVVTLTNTPADGYKLTAYSVTETGGTKTVTVKEENGVYTFKMPAYAVTVSATFETAKVLNDIDINTDAVKKEFWKGETFTSENLVVTAHFSTGDETVEPTSVTGYNMNNVGEQTVTVTFKEGLTEKSKTYTINVKSTTNTKETAFTVAEAMDIIGKGLASTTDQVYVKGTVSQIDSYNSTYKSITYWISEDGTTTNQFEIYSGKNIGNTDFSSKEDLSVGEVLIIYGIIKDFKGTKEMDMNNYIVERVKVLQSIALSGEYPTEFSLNDPFSHEGQVVTASYNYGGTQVVTESSFWSGYDMSQVGTQEVTVSYTENGIEKTAKYNITITKPCTSPITITKGGEVNGTFELSNYGFFCLDDEEGNKVSTVLTAVPAEHYHLASVTAEGCTIGEIVENQCTISNIVADVTITANFVEDAKATATFVKGEEAATGDAPANIEQYVGEEITLPANTFAYAGHVFAGWSDGNDVYQANNKYTLTTNTEFTATWNELPIWATTYTSNVTISGNKVKLAEAYQPADYPEAGYDAKKDGSGSAKASISVKVPANTTGLHYHLFAWKGEGGKTVSIKKGETVLATFTNIADEGISGSSNTYTLKNNPVDAYGYVALEGITEETTITFSTPANSNRICLFGVNAVAPAAISIDPASKDFGEVKQGFDAEQVFTLTPNAFATGTITAEIDGDEVFTASAVTDNKVTVTFAPTEIKDYSATLIIKHDGVQMCTAALTGTGITPTTPTIDVDKDNIDFGTKKQGESFESQTVAVTLNYLSAATVDVTGNFEVTPASLTESGIVTVSVKSTTDADTFDGVLTISGDGASDKVVSLHAVVADKWATTYSSNINDINDFNIEVIVEEVSYEDSGIKIGSSGKGGSATVKIPEGTEKLHFHVAAWKDKSTGMTVKMGETTLREIASTDIPSENGVSGSGSTFTLVGNTSTDQYFNIDLSGYTIEDNTEITFTTSSERVVLYGVNQEGGVSTVLQSIEIQGTASALNYEVGQTFVPTGLKVVGTFQKGEEEPTTRDLSSSEFDWSFDPATFTSTDQTSVVVTATAKENTEITDTKTIENIVVTAPVVEISTTSTKVDFGTVLKDATVDNELVYVTFKNCTEASVALSGDDADKFTIDANKVEAGDFNWVTVGVADGTTATTGEYAATLTIHAENAIADIVLPVTLFVEAPDNCDGTDDFETSENKNAGDYKERTTTDGWSAVNAARTTIVDNVFFTINGKTSAVGVITSPELEDGIASLKIRYANTNQEANGVSFRVDIKKGEDVVKTYTIIKANADVVQGTVYTETISNINVAGTYQIVFTNLSPSNSTSNKDRVSIGRLCWTHYAGAPEYDETVRENVTEGTIGTMVYEHNITAIAGAVIYKPNYVNGNELEFIEVLPENTVAGLPYIFVANGENDGKVQVNFGTEEPAIDCDYTNRGLKGNMGPEAIYVSDPAYVIYQDQIRPANITKVAVGRAYIADIQDLYALDPIDALEPIVTDAPRRRFSLGIERNTPTGFETIMMQKGMNKVIMNNQLFIIRDGKVFNAQGALVK